MILGHTSRDEFIRARRALDVAWTKMLNNYSHTERQSEFYEMGNIHKSICDGINKLIEICIKEEMK